MNRPLSGDNFRRGQYAHVMFQASAQDTPNMTVRMNPGSFWVNNNEFIEYQGGSSPKIEPPMSGAKWVLVAINKLGSAVLIHGIPKPNNPEPPTIDKNILPVAFVFVKSSTQVVSNDMIYDARPLYSAGGYPLKHSQLQGRTELDAHPLESITGLQAALDTKVEDSDLSDMFDKKADMEGTNSATFTLNKDDTGVPVEFCGIKVNRGSQLDVGLRFNEDLDRWEYTNDGTEWHPIGDDTDLYDMASKYDAGMVYLSVDPVDDQHPIVVGDNDPRLQAIANKVDLLQLQNNYVSKEELQTVHDGLAKKEEVYCKEDTEAIFLTRAEFTEAGGYSKDQLNSILSLKANKTSVFTKEEINQKLSFLYTKEEIDELVKTSIGGCHCNCGSGSGSGSVDLMNYYTSAEVDALLQTIREDVISNSTSIAELEQTIALLRTEFSASLSTKADKSEVYTRTEMDSKLLEVILKAEGGTGTGGSCCTGCNKTDMTEYYTKADVNVLLSDRADVHHGHLATEISQDSAHRFVTDEEITSWNNKQEALGYVAENVANKGVANGYASLDANGKVPLSQLPSLSVTGGGTGVEVVEDYTSLINIDNTTTGQIVFVKNASGDKTVESGWGQYLYDGESWFKIGEQESLDLVLNWENILNKPEQFIPNPEYLAGYALKNNVYTKAEVDNYLSQKSDVGHVHNDYVTDEKLEAALAGKVDTTDSKIHKVTELGSFEVNEKGLGDGMVLYYNASENALMYKKMETSSGTGEFSGDANSIGGIEYLDALTIKDGYVLTYDSETQKVMFKAPSVTEGTGTGTGSSNTVGSVTIDESSIGDGKVLTYNGEKLVYTSLPKNMLDIDDTNRAQGKVLAYNGNGKLEYVDLPASTGGTGGSGILEYTVTAGGGQKCIVKADKENAVRYTVDGNKVQLIFDVTAHIYSVQLEVLDTDIGSNTRLEVTMLNSDGKVYDWDTWVGNMPLIQWYQLDGNYLLSGNSIKYDIDNPQKFTFVKIGANYTFRCKMVF